MSSGAVVPFDGVVVDSGFNAEPVRHFVRKGPNRKAIKGEDGWSRPLWGQISTLEYMKAGKRLGQRARGKSQAHLIGTWPAKVILARFLRDTVAWRAKNAAGDFFRLMHRSAWSTFRVMTGRMNWHRSQRRPFNPCWIKRPASRNGSGKRLATITFSTATCTSSRSGMGWRWIGTARMIGYGCAPRGTLPNQTTKAICLALLQSSHLRLVPHKAGAKRKISRPLPRPLCKIGHHKMR